HINTSQPFSIRHISRRIQMYLDGKALSRWLAPAVGRTNYRAFVHPANISHGVYRVYKSVAYALK
ncbi:hypothetical protein, partial [Pseudomonas sp. MD195_PC81_125]|uniref:hypothetical protein n=1 Tax=Pseudomonas sp. MD195_PC81_125 TaxID=2741560 RepID=UPI001C70BC6F